MFIFIYIFPNEYTIIHINITNISLNILQILINKYIN